MDSFASPTSSAAPPHEEEMGATREGREEEMVHRTKAIQFLGRTIPIILQNDNGPCPLLAICNVLSLKNLLNLSSDMSEVSQEKLLSLVAEHLIDSNSSIDGKGAGYVEDRQQNMADAIDLLPRLATGIDVNIKFRRIDDFEFTRECAIFDLLDIPLYHGWIVDTQDRETAEAIGSKSYNTLVEELVSLETQATDREHKNDPEDDVDFVAATTAALGVPSPCLSRGQSFDESPRKARKGDTEEEIELLRVLKLSEAEMSVSVPDNVEANLNLVEISSADKSELACGSETLGMNATNDTIKNERSISDDGSDLNTHNADMNLPGVCKQEAICSVPKSVEENNVVQCTAGDSVKSCRSDEIKSDPQIEIQNVQPVPVYLGEDSQSASVALQNTSRTAEHGRIDMTFTSDPEEPISHLNDCESRESRSMFSPAPSGFNSSNGRVDASDKPETLASSVDGSEPIYEGEECIMESGCMVYGNQEPVYEGEVVLAAQADRGEVIRNFLKTSASQLTIYGLFCLQEKVKERELCVFFRNNHFNTMFKYQGELYILVTDQGYLNQPDLVWEKLNEVNGDTVYMTGNFTEFKMDDQSNNSTWDEQKNISSTADYLTSMDGVATSDSNFNSDLQLAIALQQQEFEQQQQSQRNDPPQSSSGSGGSRLVTGPPASQNNVKYTPSTPKSKSNKDRCTVM